MARKPDTSVLAALAPHGFPRPAGAGLGFTPEDDELLARGFPELRLLTAEAVPAAQAREQAIEALDAIDPTLEIEVPRAVAELYLIGYSEGPNLFIDAANPGDNAARRQRRQALLEAPPPAGAGLLAATLRAPHLQGMGDPYGWWRIAEVLFLYEALLGAEAVARLAVERALELARDLKSWGFAGEKPSRTNAAPHHLALALPWLLSRVPGALARELRSGLGKGPAPDPRTPGVPTAYFELLQRLAEPDAAPRYASPELDEALALPHAKLPALRARVARQGVLFAPARVAWLLGTDAFAGRLSLAGHAVDRIVLQLSPVRDAGVVRLVAHAAAQRIGKVQAGRWLARHAGHARPILESLEKVADKKESAAARAALTLLAEGVPEPRGPLSEDEAEAEIAALFAALGTELAGKKTKRARVSAIKTAFERYCEIQAAGGHPTPEANFSHCFGELGLGEWASLAVEATDDRAEE